MNEVRQSDGPAEPRLVVGLGNPGRDYETTRHNLGFRVVREIARRWRVELNQLECNALIADAPKALLAAPQTFMNRSGYAIRCLTERREIGASSILVVYDDVALGLGRLRLRGSGGPGGHRGMESVIQNLRTDEIPRLRLGIADLDAQMQPDELVDFVLAPFSSSEQSTVEELVVRGADACESWLHEGLEVTMNRFNR